MLIKKSQTEKNVMKKNPKSYGKDTGLSLIEMRYTSRDKFMKIKQSENLLNDFQDEPEL